MKKLSSVFMIFVLVMGLVACSSKNDGEGASQGTAQESSVQTAGDESGADEDAGRTEAPSDTQTDEDLNYNDRTTRATAEQNDPDVRPAIQGSITDFEQYEVVYVGYPIWQASIPMPIASFLEEYDFTGKTIIPLCSHGGGRFGQSLTVIAKLAPDAQMGKA